MKNEKRTRKEIIDNRIAAIFNQRKMVNYLFAFTPTDMIFTFGTWIIIHQKKFTVFRDRGELTLAQKDENVLMAAEPENNYSQK